MGENQNNEKYLHMPRKKMAMKDGHFDAATIAKSIQYSNVKAKVSSPEL